MKKVLHGVEMDQRAGPTTNQNDQSTKSADQSNCRKKQVPEVALN